MGGEGEGEGWLGKGKPAGLEAGGKAGEGTVSRPGGMSSFRSEVWGGFSIEERFVSEGTGVEMLLRGGPPGGGGG